MAWSALKKLKEIRAAEIAGPPRPITQATVFKVIDIIEKLPWHPTRTWGNRPLSKITEIIIHQAAANGATAKNVNKYHITPSADKDGDGVIKSWERNHLSDKGAPHIAYHYVVETDGKVYQANKLTSVTWHAKGHNTKAIGILITGYFKGPDHENANEPTEAQLKSLVNLLDYLQDDFPTIEKTKYLGHSEVDSVHKAACPGYTLMETLKKWRTF